MAFDPTPTTWIAGWSEDGTSISVPIASFPELTAAEADGATGDIRKIVFAIMEKLFATYNGTASDSKPAMMSVSKSVTVNTATGVTTNNYTVTIKTSTVAQEVVDEA